MDSSFHPSSSSLHSTSSKNNFDKGEIQNNFSDESFLAEQVAGMGKKYFTQAKEKGNRAPKSLLGRIGYNIKSFFFNTQKKIVRLASHLFFRSSSFHGDRKDFGTSNLARDDEGQCFSNVQKNSYDKFFTDLDNSFTNLDKSLESLGSIKSEQDAVKLLTVISHLKQSVNDVEHNQQTLRFFNRSLFEKEMETLDGFHAILITLISKARDVIKNNKENLQLISTPSEMDTPETKNFKTDLRALYIDEIVDSASDFIESEEIQSGSNHALEGVKPNGIPNTAQSCYRNSANQALRVLQPLRSLLEEREVVESRFQPVRDSLLDLFKALERNDTRENIIKAEKMLCRALFSAGLSEFSWKKMFGQHDAMAYLRFILDDVLGYQFQVAYERSASVNDDVIKQETPSQPMAFVRLPISQRNFQEIMDMFFSDSEAEGWRGAEEAVFRLPHKSRPVIKSEPKNVLVLQLGRDSFRGTTTVHDSTKVAFPEDGVIDFSKAHQLAPGSLKYQVKSFVHLTSGSKDFGHYVSYVKKQDQWFCCNDSVVTEVSEDDAKKALSEAYIFFFEKLPEEMA